MTREEAIKTLKDRIEQYTGGVHAGEREILLEAFAALRGPVPDPDTGLVRCGCGGKAQIVNSSGYSRRLYVECDGCAIMLGAEATGDGALRGIYCYDDQIIKDWNRAMGWEDTNDDTRKD